MTWNLYDCHNIQRRVECPQQLSASDPGCKGCRYARPTTVDSLRWRERWRGALTRAGNNGSWIKMHKAKK